MKNNDIKKALECCGSKHHSDEKYECKNCPLNGRSFDEGSCYDEVLHDNALALITSQEQRIKELTEENERLKAENKRYAELEEGCLVTGYNNIKADTVRNMQERLDKHFCHDPAFLGVEQRLIMGVIDQIAKEMLEGKK